MGKKSALDKLKGANASLDKTIDRLKGKKAKYVKIAAYTFTMTFVAILFYQGLRMMKLSSFQHSPALGISMSWVYLAIPVATFVMFCNILILIVDVLQAKE